MSLTAWERLRKRARAKAEALGVSQAELGKMWGMKTRQQVQLMLSNEGSEPRYSLGKKIEEWVNKKN